MLHLVSWHASLWPLALFGSSDCGFAPNARFHVESGCSECFYSNKQWSPVILWSPTELWEAPPDAPRRPLTCQGLEKEHLRVSRSVANWDVCNRCFLALWIVGLGLWELRLLPTDGIRPHQIAIWRVWGSLLSSIHTQFVEGPAADLQGMMLPRWAERLVSQMLRSAASAKINSFISRRTLPSTKMSGVYSSYPTAIIMLRLIGIYSINT